MKKNRFVAIFLLVALMLSSLATPVLPTSTAEAKTKTVLTKGYPTTEYERAIYYGFTADGVTEKQAAKKTMTYKSFSAMLGKMIKKYDKSKYKTWQKLTKNAPKKIIKRDGAMVALLYAAETVGLNTVNSDWHEYNDYDFWSKASLDYPVFNYQKKIKKKVDPAYDGEEATRRLDASFLYMTRRRSCVTKNTLLMPTGSDWKLEKKLTAKDAALAVVRLYESDDVVAYKTANALLKQVLKTSKAKAIVSAANKRRAAIRNSATEIVKSDTFIQGKTYTGTAYYLSNNGSDANDGKSEKTPWQSLSMLRQNGLLHYGDAVFFERGSMWYAADGFNIDNVEGLTFSAYGTGEKPKFYGSIENSSGAEKWSLYYQGSDGRKIWKYYKKMPDAGVVVFNGGKSFAKRDTPLWDGTNYYPIENYTLRKTAYDVKKDLPNLYAFPELEYPKTPYDEKYVFLKSPNTSGGFAYVEGDFYLRCDKGNPGSVYSEIQISTPHSFLNGMADYGTIDNLCLSYSTQTAAGGADSEKADSHLIFQNSECAWMGGGVYEYVTDPAPAVSVMGGGFNVNGSDETIQSCYAHHCYQEGVTLEAFSMNDGMIENITMNGNLNEYCMMGDMLINWDSTVRPSHQFKNFYYTDNMVLYSGFENFYTVDPAITEKGTYLDTLGGVISCDARAFGLMTAPDGKNAYTGTFSVSNNTFAFSANKLIEISCFTNEYSRVFHGNTYAQIPGYGWLSAYFDIEGDNAERPRTVNPNTAIKTKLNDTTAKIIRFDK